MVVGAVVGAVVGWGQRGHVARAVVVQAVVGQTLAVVLVVGTAEVVLVGAVAVHRGCAVVAAPA